MRGRGLRRIYTAFAFSFTGPRNSGNLKRTGNLGTFVEVTMPAAIAFSEMV